MLPIEKYIDAIENKDYEGLGSLFTKDGHYCDYCANGTGPARLSPVRKGGHLHVLPE